MAHKLLLSFLAASLLTGCVSLAPDDERPAQELPAAWKVAPAGGVAAPADRWWMLYGEPALDRLVEEALAHNQDLQLAVARVDEARALARIAEAQRLPSVGAAAEVSRGRRSERSSFPLPPGVPTTQDTYRGTLNVAYELDLWGRLKNTAEAARARLLATRAAQETVHLTLTAQVVQSYFNLAALDGQVEATRRSLALRLEELELQRVRHRSGLIGEFELRQREAEVASARVQLSALERAREAEEAALAVLLGRSPQAIVEGEVEREAHRDAPPAVVVPQGLPSDLLLRRPDLVEAEQSLIAAHADIGAARAALFPRIALTGFLGSESASLSDLFSGPAGVWQLAAGLTQPIFQGGRLLAEVEAAEARRRQAVAQYRKAIQQAFSEVREALARQTRSREIFEAEGSRIQALTETLRLARVRYAQGLSSQLEVLDTERSLLAAELSRIDALRDQRAAVADLVRALGGGWGEAARLSRARP
jgi:multidrug efflux system outer membrane protein